ncbi:MAG: glycosyltransferase [Candidatus Korobacteraceae bacterium]|jgi:glycosyltransferase involved in cell wall biosynthesis
MRILQVHCRYRSGYGGEDRVVEEERRLLTENGHLVDQFLASNADAPSGSAVGRIAIGVSGVWNQAAWARLRQAILNFRPDIIHVHNTFAGLSPSVYWSAASLGVPVVQTIHNYRLTCANSELLRNGIPCEECVGRLPWRALWHGCRYGGSRGAALTIAATQAVHMALGTYRRKGMVYIALSNWEQTILIRAGLPADRVHVKPNFLFAPAVNDNSPARRERKIIFAGNLSVAKGVDLLLDAWSRIPHHNHRLVLAGPDLSGQDLGARAASCPDTEWLGRIERDHLMKEIATSKWLVLPSRWYEPCALVLIEAKAVGTPLIGPSHGCAPDIVRHGTDGLLFAPSDEHSLSQTITRAIQMPFADWEALSTAARSDYVARYTPEANYQALMRIYDFARRESGSGKDARDAARAQPAVTV